MARATYDPAEMGPHSVQLIYTEIEDDGAVGQPTVVGTIPLFDDQEAIVKPYFTFDHLVGLIVTDMEDKLKDKTTFLSGYKVQNINGTQTEFNTSSVCSSLGDWNLSINVKSILKLQNITPADVAGDEANSKDAITSNSLRGRIWTFSGGAPKLRSQFATYPGLSHIEKTDHDCGLIPFPPRTADMYAHGNILHSVPAGGTIFQNIAKTASVSLAPGGFRTHIQSYRFSGTVRQFCKRMAMDVDIPFRTGDSVAFGLEPSMKTLQDEVVKLGYHIDFLSTSYLKPKLVTRVQQSNLSSLYDFVNTTT